MASPSERHMQEGHCMLRTRANENNKSNQVRAETSWANVFLVVAADDVLYPVP